MTIKTLNMIHTISKVKRTLEFLTLPNFLFFADLYAKAPKTIVAPAIAIELGCAIPANMDKIPTQIATVEPVCFFIFLSYVQCKNC